MIRTTAVTSTATPSSRSCIALTPSPMPSTFASSAKPYRKISDRLHDRKLEELTDWFQAEKFVLPTRVPTNGEIVRTDPGNGCHIDGMVTITDAGSGETYRVWDGLIWKTEGQFVHLYGRSFA